MTNLRIPGPTPIPSEVQEAMGRQMFNHRGPEFAALIARLTERLQWAFQTKNDLLILTASGSGGLEAAVVNFFSPGDHILAVTIGAFGDRFATIADRYGAKVTRLEAPWGMAANPAAVRAALRDAPDIKGVLVTHNETSTGVTNDLEAIAREVRNAGRLLVVDAVSSLGSINLPVDEWDCDVVVSGSQKGWMVPPGLAMVSVSPRAWNANKEAAMPRFYLDLGAAKTYLQRGQTPFTPALSVMVALDVSLRLMENEGLQEVFDRHARIGEHTRASAREMGLELFADADHASNTVTTIDTPAGVDAGELLRALNEEYDIVLAGGQGKLGGQVFRIGHLGWVTKEEIDAVFTALREVLPRWGFTRAGRRSGQQA